MKRSVNSFSDSVGDDEQGWVMGVTTAGRALASGIMSLLGGLLMAVDIRMPFFIAVTAALLGLVFIRTAWNTPNDPADYAIGLSAVDLPVVRCPTRPIVR